MTTQIRTKVSKVGQLYVDDKIYLTPKPRTTLQILITKMYDPFSKPLPRVLARLETVRLNWKKPTEER